ncbi:hypothetical protein ACFV23_11495, partial [Streptomyces sp. NPDC059627]
MRRPAEELTCSGRQPTERMYSDHLYSAGESPVSRQRCVQDLAYLGVPETAPAPGRGRPAGGAAGQRRAPGTPPPPGPVWGGGPFEGALPERSGRGDG